MRNRVFRLCCLLASVLLRPMANLDLVDLDSKIVRGKGLIIVANHRSVMDILVGLALFRHWGVAPRMFVKATYFAVPVVGQLLRLMRAIPASRDNARETMRTALRTLAEGGVVALAPEGRVLRAADRDDGVGDLRTGVGRLAAEFGSPIIAVGITNTDAVWPLGARRPRIRARKASRPTVRVAVAQLDVEKGTSVAVVMARLRSVLSQVVETAEKAVGSGPSLDRPSAT